MQGSRRACSAEKEEVQVTKWRSMRGRGMAQAAPWVTETLLATASNGARFTAAWMILMCSNSPGARHTTTGEVCHQQHQQGAGPGCQPAAPHFA